ncbi:MAG: hypothetical protein ACM3XR_01465 [Bacillota bacterium]
MTTINCASNCKHQHDGRCTLENAISETISNVTDCVYFEERTDKNKHGYNCKPPNELL